MINLILKDFIVLKKYILWSVVYAICMIIAFSNFQNGTVPSAIICAIFGPTYLLGNYACAFDDKNKSEVMLNSLPILRKDIVVSKYVLVFIYTVIFTILYMTVSNVIIKFELPIKVVPISIGGFLVAFFASSVFHGIYLPVYFKIGYTKSKIANFILFFTAFFVIGMIGNFIKELSNNVQVFTIIKESIGDLSQAQTNFAVFALILIFMGVSYMLSSRFYAARDF